MRRGRWIHAVSAMLSTLVLIVFGALMVGLVRQGFPDLTWQFLTSAPHGPGHMAGIGSEIINTLVMVSISLLVTAPLGMAIAIFLREYRLFYPKTVLRVNRLRATLLGLPTIVVALVVYRIAVGWWHWPISILTGTLTLCVINWPFMVSVSLEALQSVPDTYREASWALGAGKIETVRRVVVPAGLAVLIDGWGLAAARLAGESAALIMTAGVNVAQRWSFWGPGETLAVHIWYVRTEGSFAQRDVESAATGVTLLVLITIILWLSTRLARLVARQHDGGI